MQQLYWPIAAEMVEVEQVLREQMRSRYPFVDELVRYGCLLGGKRLRPALLLLTAKAVGTVTPEHLTLAAIIEMIHTATLVHDDVLDEADMRRHLATVNARWDSESSVLLGDYLFTHAFYLASTLDARACRLIGKATNRVCEGEIRQKGSRADFSISEPEYISIIDGKTAALTACSSELGAVYAAAPDGTASAMSEFGRLLGIAFQIADDLLDLSGDEEATGKSLGTDLVKQKPTLPLIRALEIASASQRGTLERLLDEPAEVNRQRLSALLGQLGAFDYSRQKALDYARQAADLLDCLADTPARQVLHHMTQVVVNRSR